MVQLQINVSVNINILFININMSLTRYKMHEKSSKNFYSAFSLNIYFYHDIKISIFYIVMEKVMPSNELGICY